MKIETVEKAISLRNDILDAERWLNVMKVEQNYVQLIMGPFGMGELMYEKSMAIAKNANKAINEAIKEHYTSVKAKAQKELDEL